jgi:S1-C subfamily serine protease
VASNSRSDRNTGSKRTLRSLNTLLTIALLFTCSSRGQDCAAQTPAVETPSLEKLSALKRAVVIVTTFDLQNKPLLQGSGFFISRDCIVTNMHVIKGAEHIRITTFDRKVSSVQKVIAANEKDDLALLLVENTLTNDILELENSAAVEGDKVVVLGNPQGSPWKITRGQVGLLWAFGDTSGRIQITASILPGSSGGPVVNGQGRVVGVAAMHIPSADDLNFAVPAENLRSLLRDSPRFASNRRAVSP